METTIRCIVGNKQGFINNGAGITIYVRAYPSQEYDDLYHVVVGLYGISVKSTIVVYDLVPRKQCAIATDSKPMGIGVDDTQTGIANEMPVIFTEPTVLCGTMLQPISTPGAQLNQSAIPQPSSKLASVHRAPGKEYALRNAVFMVQAAVEKVADKTPDFSARGVAARKKARNFVKNSINSAYLRELGSTDIDTLVAIAEYTRRGLMDVEHWSTYESCIEDAIALAISKK